MQVNFSKDSSEFHSHPFPYAIINNPFGEEIEPSLLIDFPYLHAFLLYLVFGKLLTLLNSHFQEHFL